MMPELYLRLRKAEAMRREVAEVDAALQMLSPAERMVLQMLVVTPERGNTARLCQMLEVEKSTLYRWKKQALKKVKAVLEGVEGVEGRVKLE